MYFVLILESVLLIIIVNLLFIMLSLKENSDENMISPYECGFDPSLGGRIGFSYRFFLISILFLVFDVEIILIVPVPYQDINFSLILGILYFMTILMVGLIYEYYNGVLSWV